MKKINISISFKTYTRAYIKNSTHAKWHFQIRAVIEVLLKGTVGGTGCCTTIKLLEPAPRYMHENITSLKLCREIVGDTSFEKMWLECSTLLRWRDDLEHMCSMASAQNHISWRRISFSCMMAKVRKPECVCSSPLCRDIWGQQLCWINCSAFKLQASSACPCQLEIVVIDSHFH